tara:strand:- start:7982 stop:8410 length:429 start_codon:yes stop_codon:yes gene_type:complete
VGNTLFTLVENSHTNIQFKNSINETVDFNVLKYYYTYIGIAVAIGDVNNDGLQDIYFTAIQQSNKLYLNKGDFKFEDVIAKANVSDTEGWTTDANMIDINNDGLIDLFLWSLEPVDSIRHIKFITIRLGYTTLNQLFVLIRI